MKQKQVPRKCEVWVVGCVVCVGCVSLRVWQCVQ